MQNFVISGPLLLLTMRFGAEQQKWTTYHEVLHGLISHKNNRIIGEMGGPPPWPPVAHFLGFLRLVLQIGEGV